MTHSADRPRLFVLAYGMSLPVTSGHIRYATAYKVQAAGLVITGRKSALQVDRSHDLKIPPRRQAPYLGPLTHVLTVKIITRPRGMAAVFLPARVAHRSQLGALPRSELWRCALALTLGTDCYGDTGGAESPRSMPRRARYRPIVIPNKFPTPSSPALGTAAA